MSQTNIYAYIYVLMHKINYNLIAYITQLFSFKNFFLYILSWQLKTTHTPIHTEFTLLLNELYFILVFDYIRMHDSKKRDLVGWYQTRTGKIIDGNWVWHLLNFLFLVFLYTQFHKKPEEKNSYLLITDIETD